MAEPKKVKMQVQMVNPSPVDGFEIKTGDLAGKYMVPVVTLAKGMEFERLSGLKFMRDGWWEDLAGIAAFMFITIRETKPDLDWESFLDLIDLREVDVILRVPEVDDAAPLDVAEAARIADEILATLSSGSTDGDSPS